MFKLEKQKDKAVLTIYGYVGGYYLDFRAVNAALDDIKNSGYNKLDFRFHTYGGDVIDGNLIYNFLAGFNGEVNIYIDGVAASMGSIIMMASANIEIAENGFVMVHSPSGGAYGTARDLTARAKLLTSMEKNFKAKLMERTGKSEAEINAWFDGSEHWFDADECVALKLVNKKFSAKTQNLTTLDKTEAEQIGAKAVFDRFTALVADPNINNSLETKNQNQSQQMKEALIKKYGLTGVTAQSTDEEIMAAIDAKMNAEKTAAEATAKANLKKAVETATDAAISAKKITDKQRETYIARGEKLGIDEYNALLGDMKPYEPIASHIQGKGGEGPTTTDRKGWTWKDYQEKAVAELEAMPTKDPETFKALYKAEFGSEPVL